MTTQSQGRSNRAAIALMALVAGCSVVLIVMLFGAWGYRQLGPGGLLSDVRVGQPAPEFELAAHDGSTIRLSDYRGQPVALNFWASWCAACVTELPLLEQLQSDHADEQLVVLGVNNWDRADEVQAFLAERDLVLTVPLDPRGEVNSLYNVQSLPTTVWIDADGVVQDVHVGAMSADALERYASELVDLVRTQSP